MLVKGKHAIVGGSLVRHVTRNFFVRLGGSDQHKVMVICRHRTAADGYRLNRVASDE